MHVLTTIHQRRYYHELKFALDEYDRVTGKIMHVTRAAFEPHLQSLDLLLRPGMVSLTWTSLNIDAYKLSIHDGLQKLEELIRDVNDILDNRIDKNLQIISKTVLVDLPEDESVTLDDFVQMQEKAVANSTDHLKAKNMEVETAVEDLVSLINGYPLSPTVGPVSEEDLTKLRQHYNSLTYRALLNCTRNSMNQVKKRVCSRAGSGFLFGQSSLVYLPSSIHRPHYVLTTTHHWLPLPTTTHHHLPLPTTTQSKGPSSRWTCSSPYRRFASRHRSTRCSAPSTAARWR